MSDELVDYVIEFIADNDEVFRILVKQRMGLETHIYALKRAAQFIIENDIVRINILRCKGYICDEEIAKVRVEGLD